VLLTEIARKSITVYHGDDYNTKQINGNYARMYSASSNVQEGIGIYFTPDIEVAQSYGKNISSTVVDMDDILPARGIVSDHIPHDRMVALLTDLNNNNEDFWYMISDYMGVTERDEVDEYHIEGLAETVSNQEIRNTQIELLEASDVTTFVKAWLKHIKKYGTFEKESKFFALMYNDEPLVSTNF